MNYFHKSALSCNLSFTPFPCCAISTIQLMTTCIYILFLLIWARNISLYLSHIQQQWWNTCKSIYFSTVQFCASTTSQWHINKYDDLIENKALLQKLLNSLKLCSKLIKNILNQSKTPDIEIHDEAFRYSIILQDLNCGQENFDSVCFI